MKQKNDTTRQLAKGFDGADFNSGGRVFVQGKCLPADTQGISKEGQDDVDRLIHEAKGRVKSSYFRHRLLDF